VHLRNMMEILMSNGLRLMEITPEEQTSSKVLEWVSMILFSLNAGVCLKHITKKT